jgi:hypothetical protein
VRSQPTTPPRPAQAERPGSPEPSVSTGRGDAPLPAASLFHRFLSIVRRGARPASLEALLFWLSFACLLGLSGSLALAHRFVPLLDWPEHLAAAATTLRFNEEGWRFSEYYRRPDLFQPYHVFRWLQTGAGALFGDLGLRAALLVPLWGPPITALALARLFGRDRWIALGVFCLVVDSNLQWGFVPYITAIVGLLAMLALLGSWMLVPHGGKLLGLAALGVVLFFSHPVPTLLGLLAVAVVVLPELATRRLRLPDAFAIAGALLPAAGLLIAFLFGSGWAGGGSAGPSASLSSFATMKAFLLDADKLTGLSTMGPIPAWSYAAILLATGVGAAAERIRRGSAPNRWRALHLPPFSLFVLFATLALILPDHVKGQSISLRIFSTAALFLLLAVPFRGQHAATAWPVRAIIVASALCTLSFWTVHFARFDRDNAALGRIIDGLPRGKRVAVMPYVTSPPDIPLILYLHVSGYVHAERGGYSSFSFGHVPYKPEFVMFSLTPVIYEMARAGWQLPAAATDFYDYVIVVKGPRYPGTPFAPLPPGRRPPERVFVEGPYELWETRR